MQQAARSTENGSTTASALRPRASNIGPVVGMHRVEPTLARIRVELLAGVRGPRELWLCDIAVGRGDKHELRERGDERAISRLARHQRVARDDRFRVVEAEHARTDHAPGDIGERRQLDAQVDVVSVFGAPHGLDRLGVAAGSQYCEPDLELGSAVGRNDDRGVAANDLGSPPAVETFSDAAPLEDATVEVDNQRRREPGVDDRRDVAAVVDKPFSQPFEIEFGRASARRALPLPTPGLSTPREIPAPLSARFPETLSRKLASTFRPCASFSILTGSGGSIFSARRRETPDWSSPWTPTIFSKPPGPPPGCPMSGSRTGRAGRRPTGCSPRRSRRKANCISSAGSSPAPRCCGRSQTWLQLQAAWQATPAIRRAVDEPLFVVGPPRTGTTILLELLALDPALRAPIAYEALYPLRAMGSDRTPVGTRRVRARVLGRHPPRVHDDARTRERSAVRVRALLDVRLGRSVLVDDSTTRRHSPAGSWNISKPSAACTSCTAECCRRLRTRRPTRRRARWLLKSPYHVATLPALFAEYPDARVIHTHRDPRKFMGSLVSLLQVVRFMRSDHVDITMGPVLELTYQMFLDNTIAQREERRNSRTTESSTRISSRSWPTRSPRYARAYEQLQRAVADGPRPRDHRLLGEQAQGEARRAQLHARRRRPRRSKRARRRSSTTSSTTASPRSERSVVAKRCQQRTAQHV